MKKSEILADYDHPIVKALSEHLTSGLSTEREKLEKLFYYVRDEIKFAFPTKGDLIKASEIIQQGQGQCNNKTTLMLALCKVIGIPAKSHFSLIEKDIQKGLFTGFAFKAMPSQISHSWIEVYIEGKWRRLDSYINDIDFYNAGKSQLRKNGWDVGYSISCSNGESSAAFNIDEENFVQMGAVTEDHGTWSDPGAYFASDLYRNRPNVLKLLLYRLKIRSINKKVKLMRNSCADGLCGISSN